MNGVKIAPPLLKEYAPVPQRIKKDQGNHYL